MNGKGLVISPAAFSPGRAGSYVSPECLCGKPAVLAVSVTEPLVSVSGPVPVCMECEPQVRELVDRICKGNRRMFATFRPLR
jgi:hypothetical protein